MLFQATKIRTYIIALSIYFIGLAVFLYFEQAYFSQNQLNAIDTELRLAVDEARTKVIKKTKLDISGNINLSTKQDLELANKLTELASAHGLDFIYTVILQDEKILFTSSSMTPEEASGEQAYEPAFKEVYDDASLKLYDAFRTGELSFDNYTDKWGSFRTFYHPIFKGDKVSYIIAADISITKIKNALFKTFITSLLLGLFLSLIAFPLILFSFRSIKKEHEAEKIILYTDSETGLKNFTKLCDDIKINNNLKLTLIEVENYNEILNINGPDKTAHIIKQLINRIRLFLEENNFDVEIYTVEMNKFGLLTAMDLATFDQTCLQNLFNSLVKTGYGIMADEAIHLRLRIGIAANESSLFALTNMALDKAKESNKSIVFFNGSDNLPNIYLENTQQEMIFLKALNENRVKAFFQPIVDANTANISKFECLVRVVDEDNNVIQIPAEFLPIAYKSRLSHKITRLMLDQSLETIQNHSQSFSISINISVSDLFDSATINYICERLDQSSQAERIEFEILEHESIQDYNKAANLILKLKKRGCQVGMDDLGKHYSNFDRLSNLPLDFVKIDGGIMPFIQEDEMSLKIVKNIIDLSKDRNLKIVAEYCINESVYNAAVQLGIDYLQGYFISQPKSKISDILDDYDQIKLRLTPLSPGLKKPHLVKAI